MNAMDIENESLGSYFRIDDISNIRYRDDVDVINTRNNIDISDNNFQDNFNPDDISALSESEAYFSERVPGSTLSTQIEFLKEDRDQLIMKLTKQIFELDSTNKKLTKDLKSVLIERDKRYESYQNDISNLKNQIAIHINTIELSRNDSILLKEEKSKNDRLNIELEVLKEDKMRQMKEITILYQKEIERLHRYNSGDANDSNISINSLNSIDDSDNISVLNDSSYLDSLNISNDKGDGPITNNVKTFTSKLTVDDTINDVTVTLNPDRQGCITLSTTNNNSFIVVERKATVMFYDGDTFISKHSTTVTVPGKAMKRNVKRSSRSDFQLSISQPINNIRADITVENTSFTNKLSNDFVSMIRR